LLTSDTEKYEITVLLDEDDSSSEILLSSSGDIEEK
jgi:hypothetical protein